MKYVAVVLTPDNKSKKPDGDHACFVAESKDEAVTLALRAVKKWTTHYNVGRYHVEVGTLTEIATDRVEYVLTPLY